MGYGQLRSRKLVTEERFEEAIAAAAAEIAADPAEPEAYFNRGQALAGEGRFAEAAADYERALRMDASASALDPEAVDDELFFALRRQAEELKAAPVEAIAALGRYLEVLPEGRHVADVSKWIDKLSGREALWFRDRA
ncbi:MAG TPA: tetratricopeptide repeat protein [Polyangia bacterium]|nr:tetratricopeptide repeat protein [Polyangia bacterium]